MHLRNQPLPAQAERRPPGQHKMALRSASGRRTRGCVMSTRRRIGRGTLAVAVIVLASGGSIFSSGSDAGALKVSKVRVKSVPINQTVGNAVLLQATVSGTPAPTGTVEFFEGATSLG